VSFEVEPGEGVAVVGPNAAGVAGLYLSFYTAVAAGAAIVLVAVGLFLAVLLIAPRGRRSALRVRGGKARRA